MTKKQKLVKPVRNILASTIVLAMLFTAVPVPYVHADYWSDQLEAVNAAKEEASSKRESAQEKVDTLTVEQSAAIEAKIALEERNAAAAEEIALIEAEIDLYDQMIAEKEKDVRAAKLKEDNQFELYRSRVRAMEESSSYNILAIILKADSFTDLLSAIDDYSDVMDSDKKLFEQLQDARLAHEEIAAEYEEYKEECEAQKTVLDAAKAELEAEIAESKAYLEQLRELLDGAEEELAATIAAEEAAEAEVLEFMKAYYAEMAAREAAAAEAARQEALAWQQSQQQQQSGDSGTSGTVSDSGSEPSYAPSAPAVSTGGFIWPFPGHTIITSPFGYRPSTGTSHTGIDIDGYQSRGSTIVAADGGTVIKAAYSGGYGNCIMIDHGNGLTTLYAHLDSIWVSVGSTVSQGQGIGGVGSTGTVYGADGIHLHFEVLVSGSRVDPLGYLGGCSYSFY